MILPGPGKVHLPWVRTICKREWFSSALFRVVAEDDSKKLWRFLFASQNPLVVGFVQIERHGAPAYLASPEDMMADATVWAFHCKVVGCAFVFSDQPGFARETGASTWLVRAPSWTAISLAPMTSGLCSLMSCWDCHQCQVQRGVRTVQLFGDHASTKSPYEGFHG